MDHKTITDGNAEERSLTIGGRSLEETLRTDQRALIDLVLTRLASDRATYGSLPPEELLGDIAAATERALQMYLDVLTSGGEPDAAALDDLGESAARRAEEGIPLADVLDAYLLGVRVILEEVSRDLRPGEEQDLLAAATRAIRFLETTTVVVVTRYLDEHQLMSDVRTDAERHALGELLRGGSAETTGQIAGINVADAYTVIRLAIAPHRDEQQPGVDASIAAHRKVRRVRSKLFAEVGAEPISSITPSGGMILVPCATGDLDGDLGGTAWWTSTSELVAALGQAADADMWAAADVATVDGIADAAIESEQVLDLVKMLGKPPGTYRLADVPLEYQLTRPGPARTALAATLAPLAEHPELLATLRTYVAVGGNRRRTALDHHVHPNTIDYRIRRVASLTGIDPTDSAGAFQISAALLAHDATW